MDGVFIGACMNYRASTRVAKDRKTKLTRNPARESLSIARKLITITVFDHSISVSTLCSHPLFSRGVVEHPPQPNPKFYCVLAKNSCRILKGAYYPLVTPILETLRPHV